MSPDFVPSLFPHMLPREVEKAKYRYEKFKRTTELKWKRFNAIAAVKSKRKNGVPGHEHNYSSNTESQSVIPTPSAQAQKSDANLQVQPSNIPAPSQHGGQSSSAMSINESQMSAIPLSCSQAQTEHSTQTGNNPCTNEFCKTALKRMNDECLALRAELYRLRDQVQQMTFTKETFEGNDEKVKQLTSLSSYTNLMVVFNIVLKLMQGNVKEFKLSRFQEFVMTLMYLTLNVPFQFFYHVFRISKTTTFRIVNDTLSIMHDALSSLIEWPSREPSNADLPGEANMNGNVAIVIDCFEIPVRPRKKSKFKYQQPTSVKYLIGTTPEGVVSFVSKGWPGDTNDTEIAESCGILEKLAHGDVVIADRKFEIRDSVSMSGALLQKPAPAKGAKVPSAAEAVIMLLHDRYAVLQGTINYCHCHAASPEELTRLDKMVKICCALHNLNLADSTASREGGED